MFWSILIFLAVLSILVLVHELGHFWVAKKNGIWVEEFGFGIPPRIFSRKVGETIYSLNLLPFGGFVRLHGELTDDPSASSGQVFKKDRAFLTKSKLIKTSVIIAGVVMNFLLGIVAFAIVYSFSGIPKESGEVKVLNIATNSPAQDAKIIAGDIIKKVDGEEVKSVSEFVAKIETKKGKKVVLELQDRKVNITPRIEPPPDEGPLGVSISSTEIYFPPVYQRPFYGAYYGTKEAIFWGKNVIFGFANIFTHVLKVKLPKIFQAQSACLRSLLKRPKQEYYHLLIW